MDEDKTKKHIPLELREEFAKFADELDLGQREEELFFAFFDYVRKGDAERSISLRTDERVRVRANFSLEDERFVSLYYKKEVQGKPKLIEKTIIVTPQEKEVLIDLYSKGMVEEFENRILPQEAYQNLRQRISVLRKKIDDVNIVPIDSIRGVGYVMHVLGAKECHDFRNKFDIAKPICEQL